MTAMLKAFACKLLKVYALATMIIVGAYQLADYYVPQIIDGVTNAFYGRLEPRRFDPYEPIDI